MMTIISLTVKISKNFQILDNGLKTRKIPIKTLCYKANDTSELIESKFALQLFAYTQTSHWRYPFIQ